MVLFIFILDSTFIDFSTGFGIIVGMIFKNKLLTSYDYFNKVPRI